MFDNEDVFNDLSKPLGPEEKKPIRPFSSCDAKNERMEKFFMDFPRMQDHQIVEEFVEDLDDLDIYDIQVLSVLFVHTPFRHEIESDPVLRHSRDARRRRRHFHLQEIKRRVNEIKSSKQELKKRPSLLSSLVSSLFSRKKDDFEL